MLIKVTDQSGKPVSGATIKTLAKMPGMSMGEREQLATPGSSGGEYTAPAVFAMGGAYEATIEIEGPQGSGKTVLPLSTGEDTERAGGGFNLLSLWPWLLVAAALVFVVVRIRKSGQRVHAKSLFTRQVLLSLLVLGAALAIAVWAVKTQRREGAMTPIEAQVMEMNAPAPEGVIPVRLVKAELKEFAPTVSYSGQAVGFVEQDVVPRVTGAIVAMPVYVGDRVRKGQVLARLDTSQLDPMVGEKIAGVNTAQKGVDVAALEYQQALGSIAQAKAEASMAEGELAEARSMLEATQQGRGSAESEVTSAEAEVKSMEAELAAAQADEEYQRQDLERMRALFEKGVISKDEWQKSQSDARKSSAMVDKARENVRRAQSAVSSARAMLKRTDAEISAAGRKVQQAQANVAAKRAAVRTSEAGAKASKSKVGQSAAGVAEAAASLRGATTQRGFAELKSNIDGLVTSRLVSPGTVVAPGQAVLKLAQVSPIRLQANVPESDLDRIAPGARVTVRSRGDEEHPLLATVTSVSPGLDPSSRTGIVEALYPNTGGKIKPGQYLAMDITVGSVRDSVVVPSSAVLTETADQGNRSYAWIAKASANGEYTVSRKEVQVGPASGGLVPVSSGLSSGELLVDDPPPSLVEGSRVSAPSQPVAATNGKPQVVEITDAGYVPPSIQVPAGRAFKVTFIRRASETCGTEVIFPSLSIRKELPLNVPVTIEIPPQPQGRQLEFTCPMNMLKGKAVPK